MEIRKSAFITPWKQSLLRKSTVHVPLHDLQDNNIVKRRGRRLMKTARFQTNKRLWIWFSLILFLLFWFAPCTATGQGLENNAKRMWSLLRRLAHPDFPRFDEQDNLFGAVLLFIFFMGSTGGLALVVGWLLQWVVVMVRTARTSRRAKTNHAS
jgi:hypothetical protein